MKRLILTAVTVLALTLSAPAKPEGTPAAPKPSKSTIGPAPAAKLISPKPMEALPWWGDPTYPIIHDSKPMDVLQIMAFGLRPAVLAEEWVALNWYSKENRFKLETLPVGTIVLVDQFGHVQYKYDCSNRLVQPTNDGFPHWPSTMTILPTTGPTTPLPTTTIRSIDRWLSRFFSRFSATFD